MAHPGWAPDHLGYESYEWMIECSPRMPIIFKSDRPKLAGAGHYMVLQNGVPQNRECIPWMWDVVPDYCLQYFQDLAVVRSEWTLTWRCSIHHPCIHLLQLQM